MVVDESITDGRYVSAGHVIAFQLFTRQSGVLFVALFSNFRVRNVSLHSLVFLYGVDLHTSKIFLFPLISQILSPEGFCFSFCIILQFLFFLNSHALIYDGFFHQFLHPHTFIHAVPFLTTFILYSFTLPVALHYYSYSYSVILPTFLHFPLFLIVVISEFILIPLH